MYVDDIEGQVVAGQVKHNHEWTQIGANSWERDRPGRCGVRLATRPAKTDGDVFDATRTTARQEFAWIRVDSRWRLPAGATSSPTILYIYLPSLIVKILPDAPKTEKPMVGFQA